LALPEAQLDALDPGLGALTAALILAELVIRTLFRSSQEWSS